MLSPIVLTTFCYRNWKYYAKIKCKKLAWVVFNTDNPSIPEVNCSEPDFCTIASAVCFSDPSLKPCRNKTKDSEKKQSAVYKSDLFH